MQSGLSGMAPFRIRSISGRIAAIASVLVPLILVLGGLAISMFLRDVLERTFDRRLVEVLDGVIAASAVAPDGALQVERSAFFQPGFESGSEENAGGDPFYARPYWQIGRAEGTASRLLPEAMMISHVWGSGWALTIPDDLSGADYTPIHQAGPEGQALHVFARRIRLPGAEDWVPYAVAGDLRVVEDEVARLNAILVGALGVLGLLLVGTLFVQVRLGLRPLRAASQRLADIRAGRATRLEGEFPTEVAGLTGELNALLDYNVSLIERGRTQIGDLAHCLKTPLAVLTNETDKQERIDSELTRQQIESMRDHIDRYLMRARMAAAKDLLGARTPVLEAARSLQTALTRLYADKAVEIELLGDEALAFRGEREDLSEMLGNLLDNACAWAEGRVRLNVAGDEAGLTVTVEDDGPGLPADKRDAVLARGERLGSDKPGSGLGLSIVQEIAEAYGGSIALDSAELGGLRAVLALPAAGDGG